MLRSLPAHLVESLWKGRGQPFLILSGVFLRCLKFTCLCRAALLARNVLGSLLFGAHGENILLAVSIDIAQHDGNVADCVDTLVTKRPGLRWMSQAVGDVTESEPKCCNSKSDPESSSCSHTNIYTNQPIFVQTIGPCLTPGMSGAGFLTLGSGRTAPPASTPGRWSGAFIVPQTQERHTTQGIRNPCSGKLQSGDPQWPSLSFWSKRNSLVGQDASRGRKCPPRQSPAQSLEPFPRCILRTAVSRSA